MHKLKRDSLAKQEEKGDREENQNLPPGGTPKKHGFLVLFFAYVITQPKEGSIKKNHNFFLLPSQHSAHGSSLMTITRCNPLLAIE